MTELSFPDLPSLFRQADHARERLILVVGVSGSGKTAWLRDRAAAHGLAYLSVGAVLAPALVDVAPRQRPLAIGRTLDVMLRSIGNGICLDNTDLLFLPELRCDPLRLLAQLSQHRLVVASLTGMFSAGRFSRAYPDHPEYTSVLLSGVTVVHLASGYPTFFQT